MADLRALLGDRYDDVMQAACGCDGTRVPHCFECSDSTWDHECPDPVPCAHRAAGAVLARVLPDLLAEAWDECSAAWQAYLDGRTNNVPPLNPYHAEGDPHE